MGLDLEALKNKKARRGSTGWTPKEGDNLVRLLPYTLRYFTEDVSDFAIEFRSHFLKADGADTEVFRCPRDRKETCQFCAAAQKYKESTVERLKKAAEQIRGSERHLMNIIDLNDVAAGVQSYESGPKVYDGFMEYVSNLAWGDMLSPQEGRNFTVKLVIGTKAKSGYNEYTVSPHPEKSDIVAHLPADWKEKLDALESNTPRFPTPEDQVRWLTLLGMVEGSPVAVAAAPVAPVPQAPAPVPMPAPVAPAPMPVPPAPGVAPAVQPVAVGTSPISAFGLPYNIGTKVVMVGLTKDQPKEVPACYSEGPTRTDIGFNPQKYPCNAPCPVKADCQIRQLGL